MIRKSVAIAFLVAAATAGIPMAAAAPEPTSRAKLDRIVAMWAAATGGIDRIRALSTVRMSGKIAFGGDPADPFTVVVARPGKIRTEVKFPQGVWLQIFDGQRGWIVSPLSGSAGPVPMTEEELRNAPEQADIEGALVDSARKGIHLALEGKETVGGKDAWRIRVTRGNGVVRYLDLDVSTSLKVHWEGELGSGAERKMSASEFSDYRTVSGLSFPFRIVSGVVGEPPNQEIVFEKIEVNPAIPASAFEAQK
jgi:outer membrane lipoprotein-sorting protein